MTLGMVTWRQRARPRSALSSGSRWRRPAIASALIAPTLAPVKIDPRRPVGDSAGMITESAPTS